MRYEVIDYYQSQGYAIPDIIERGATDPKWHVNQKQVESACEYVYLQIQKGVVVERIDLGRYTLNKARQLRIGNYYRVNLGDPVLLDDLTAIKTLENNLLQNNIDKADLRDRLYRWQFSFAMLLTLIISIILNMVL